MTMQRGFFVLALTGLLSACASGGNNTSKVTFGSGNGTAATDATDGETDPSSDSDGSTGSSETSPSGSDSDSDSTTTEDPTDSSTAGPTTEDLDTSSSDTTGSESDSDTDPDTEGDTDTDTGGDLNCAEGIGLACTEATDLGPIQEGQMASSLTNKVLPGSENWFWIQFPSDTRPGGGTPSIELSVNEANAFSMEIIMGDPCVDGPLGCGIGGDDNGQAGTVTHWTFVDDNEQCCAPPNDSMTPWPAEVFVRVFRDDDVETCRSYQITASR